ncbi:MAG: PilZ domain-containing protein [Bacillota bacterium]
MSDGADGTSPAGPQRRAHGRFRVSGEATVRREGGNNYRVRVFDISESGCKVEVVERPSVDEGMWVKFDGLERLHATVSWVAPPVAGLRFDRPIHPAVFAALVARVSRGGTA